MGQTEGQNSFSKTLAAHLCRVVECVDPAAVGMLADVIGMHYGPFSERFKYFDCSIGKSWLCLVVEFEERTLDIVCDSVQQVGVLVP